MKFHIVQMGETIEEIIFLYNLNKNELMEENRHIKKWDKLIPGTKLKIPVITEIIDEEVMEIEPFIEDYYPKMKKETEEVFEEIIKEEDEDKEVEETNLQEETNIQEETNYNYEVRTYPKRKKVYPYYRYYYPRIVYPYYPYRYKKNNPR